MLRKNKTKSLYDIAIEKKKEKIEKERLYKELNLDKEKNTIVFDKEKNTGINYKNYSGAVNITIPSGKISDYSGNKNKTQSITLGINNSDDSGNKVIVDIIDPAWEIKDIQKNVQSGTITFKLIGKDKYLKETN